MLKHAKKIGIGLFVLGFLVSPGAVEAQTNSRNATSAATPAARMVSEDKVSNYKQKILAEIDRRVAALNGLLSKVSSSERLSVDMKNSLVTEISVALTELKNIRVSVELATDVAALRTQAKLASDSYRTYAFILPKIELLAAASMHLARSQELSSIAAKLEGSVASDSAALSKSLQTVGTLLGQINTRTNQIISNVINLRASGYPGNKSGLVTHRGSLQKNISDFKLVIVELRKAFGGSKNDQASTGSAKLSPSSVRGGAAGTGKTSF